MNYKNVLLVLALGVSGLSYGMQLEPLEDCRADRKRTRPHEKLRAKIERLIEQKRDLNAPIDYIGNPPLLEVAYNQSNADLLEKLLKNGADPNVKNWDSNIALHNTALYGNAQGARLLLQYGAQCNMKEMGIGWTPLAKAARSDSPSLDLVKLLLKYNADPNIQNNFGDTALFEAVKKLADDSRCLKDWREKGDTHMIEWLQEGIKTRKEIIRLLLQHGANPLIASKGGINAGRNTIHIAQEKGLNDIVQLLQERRKQMIDRLARFLSGQVMTEGCPSLPLEIARIVAEFRYSYDESPVQNK